MYTPKQFLANLNLPPDPKEWAVSFAKHLHAQNALKSLTAGGLRILCYHGFSTFDEHEWMPGVFMRPQTFRERMRILKEGGYNVLPLAEAVTMMLEDRLPPLSAVITMDDGWYSSMEFGHQICREFGFPYTIYVSSYYSDKRSSVFNMALQYFFWKTAKTKISLDDLKIPLSGTVHIGDQYNEQYAAGSIQRYASGELNLEQRSALLEELASVLEIDYAALKEKRVFEFMTDLELKQLKAEGVDIQLHTHRHKLPLDQKSVDRELADNRLYLEPIVGEPLNHFCYPSGIWDECHLPWLATNNIQTAVTTDSGYNYRDTNPHLLKRFVDFENYSPHIFEGELMGIFELARKVRSCFR